VILDTGFLIDLLAGDPDAEVVADELDESGRAAVSVITVMELYEGIHLAERTDQEHRRVVELLDGINSRPVTGDVATTAGEVSAVLSQRGLPIGVEDVLIGSTALVANEPVVTRNVRHFERIDGLDVREY